MFSDPSIHIFSNDIVRLANFYEHLGFRETFRTPSEGIPSHIEVTLEQFTIGISTVEAARQHGLSLNLNGRPVGILLWTDDVDRRVRKHNNNSLPLRQPSDQVYLIRIASTPHDDFADQVQLRIIHFLNSSFVSRDLQA